MLLISNSQRRNINAHCRISFAYKKSTTIKNDFAKIIFKHFIARTMERIHVSLSNCFKYRRYSPCTCKIK